MLLTAKITKPKYAPGIIDRPRLYRQLDRWQDFRAVVIHAPAGYGKSTLISRWIDVSDLGGRLAWFSFEEDDSDPHQFIRYIAAALDNLLPGLLTAVQPVLKDRKGSAQRVLTRLLTVLEGNSLRPSAATGMHLLLVLDDLQRTESLEVETLIHRVLEYGPDNLHLMLLARQRTALSLARLFAHGEILALNKQDLRFTEKEVQAYLKGQGFHTANASDLVQLTQRSEGWVSGLQLAVLSLRERGSVPELLRALQGDRDWLAEFLADEVLGHQRPELRLFLLQTSILDGFNPSLCMAVTGMNDANAKLAEIARADLFLIEMDSDGGWFRYHHLFQELLQQRLAVQFDTGAVADLHRRAAAWLAAEGQVQAAVHHLLAGGFEEEAADLVESRMRKMLVRDLIGAKRLFGLLPPHIWQQRAQLLLDRSFLALLLDERQALDYVQQAAEILQAQGLAAENAPTLHGEWLVLNSGASLIANDFAATVSFARQAQPYVDNLDDLTAGTLQFIQTHIQHIEGEQAEMLQSAERAQAAFARADFLLGTIAVQRQLAKWSADRGHSQEATRRFRALLDVPTHDRPEIVDELTFTNIYAAENSYWQNDLEQAQIYQQASLLLAQQLQDDVLIYCSRTMGMIYQPDKPEITTPTKQFDSQLEEGASRGSLEVLIDLDIRLLTAAGNAEGAWAVAQRIGIDLVNKPANFQHRSLIPYLRAYIARGLDLASVMPQLAGALTFHAKIGNRFNQLQLLALTAWLQLKMHQGQTAVATLAEATHLAQETGYVRVLLDIPELASLLPQVDHKLDLVPSPMGKNGTAINLTAREHEVLTLLAAGCTYQQISNEMLVSLNTVRTHVRHVYEKLSANSRIQAIDAARRQGLLNGHE